MVTLGTGARSSILHPPASPPCLGEDHARLDTAGTGFRVSESPQEAGALGTLVWLQERENLCFCALVSYLVGCHWARTSFSTVTGRG